ncbi:MAG: 6-phosphogluconolactonase, partial [Acidimicrobiia bacterium]|nr:6-phosphogluconolactonase [Acidimicrobiia bacterium]
MPITLEVLADAAALARRASDEVAAAAASAIGHRGSFAVAVSGGSTPRLMLEHLATRDDIEWDRVTIFQVDERVAPEGHPDRNLVMLEDALTSKVAV